MKSKSTSRAPMRRAKKAVAKKRSVRAKKNMDTFFLKAKTLFNQVPSQGVTVANFISGGTNLYSGNLLGNAEFLLYAGLYDKFRVNRVRVTATPKANVFNSTDAQDDGRYNLSGDGMIHTCIDRDSTPPPSIARISRYPSYKSFSLLKKWTRRYDVKYPTGVWLDCNDLAGASNAQIAAQLGLGGGVFYYAENVIEDNFEVYNEPWAEIKFEYDVVFQGKTSGSLTAVTDASGNVIGVSVVADKSTTPFVMSPMTNIRGMLVKDSLTVSDTVEVPIADVPIVP